MLLPLHRKYSMTHTPIRRSPAGITCKLSVLAFALLAATGAAHAADGDKIFSFSGFGTLGVANSSSSDGDYTANQGQPDGTGRTHNWAPIDTKLAGQLTARWDDQLSAVVQVVAMKRVNNRYEPKVEWAFIKFAPTPELSIMVGRTVLPTFMASETRLLGFSNPWVRPPLETYNQNPTTNLDGVNVSFRKNFGSLTNTLQAFYGNNTAQIVGATGALTPKIDADPVRGIVNTVEVGSWTIRASATYLDLALSPAPHVRVTAPDFHQFNVGVMYDSGNWFVQSEYSLAKELLVASDSRAFYATVGMRMNAFTPYATYSKSEPTGHAYPLNSGQTSTSVGLRWDAVKNVAIKAQFDHVKLGANSFGTFVNVKPGMLAGSSNVASIAVDFVY